MEIKLKTSHDKAILESEAAKPSADPKWWAKPSCKHCYGRGVVGVITIKIATNTIKNTQLCSCAKKNFMRWRDAWIEDWNKHNHLVADGPTSIPESTAIVDKVP